MLSLFLSQVLNGLVLGSVYALVALGFSLVFGVANIVNFAQGALVMLGAFFALSAVGAGVPLWLACVIAIGGAALFGFGVERLTLRPLRNAPYIAPLLSTLAIAIIFDTAAEKVWGAEMQPFPSPLQNYVTFVGGAFVTGVDALTAVAAALTAGGFWLFLRATWTGRALRAAAQDPEAAAQMGVNVGRMRALAFGLAGGLAGLAGVLAAMYYQNVFPQMGVPFGLKGFAAALLGGLASLPGAVIGGLTLGVLESLASGFIGEGYRDLAAYSVLLLVVVLRPHGLLGSGRLDALGGAAGASGGIPTTSIIASLGGATARVRGRVWEAPVWAMLAALAALACAPLLGVSGYVLQVGAGCAIFAMLSASLTVLSGSAGVVSVGHAALFGVGAYASALAAIRYGLPLEGMLLAGAVAGAVAGALAALPTLRLSGHTVALATLAIGQVGYLTFLNWISVTRGPMGVPGVPRPSPALWPGADMGALVSQYWLSLALLAGVIVLLRLYVDSPVGRVWRAIREDRIAAQGAGVPVKTYLTLAFVVSGLCAGLAGAQFAMLQNFVSPDSFILETSIILIAMAVLGGLGNITGAVIAGGAMALMPEILREFEDWRMIVYGLILLALLRFRPQGLAGVR
jgi:branched-chain amino acid transport system permease protein